MIKTPRDRLAGKTAVITGGAAGIGRATSLMFAGEGARVAIIDINKAAAQETAQMIRDAGGVADVFQADVSKSDQVDRAFDQIAKDVGPYDILFNHAGTIIVKPLHESTEADYDRLMDINVRSAFLVCRRALPEMVANGGGSVVITASIASELGYALEVALLHVERCGPATGAHHFGRVPRAGHPLQRRLPGVRKDRPWPARDRRA